MTFLKRYLEGETKQVYQEIHNLGQEAFTPKYLPDIESVLEETFKRVFFNLEILYNELKAINYLFNEHPKFNFEKPFHKPLPNTEQLLNELDSVVRPFGYVPLSLKYFYRIVGGVNFVWDYETNDHFMWDMADPVQVCSLDSLAEEVTDQYWKEDIQYYVDDENFGCAFLNLSADDLHKDNVSGGQQYALKITKQPSVDADFLNEPNDTTFIDYLRIVFDYGGFPGNPESERYHEFLKQIKPELKAI